MPTYPQQPEPKPMVTFGESLRRARDAGASECKHGELRGPKYCPLCRGVRSKTATTWVGKGSR